VQRDAGASGAGRGRAQLNCPGACSGLSVSLNQMAFAFGSQEHSGNDPATQLVPSGGTAAG
jgi:hypothetical protein